MQAQRQRFEDTFRKEWVDGIAQRLADIGGWDIDFRQAATLAPPKLAEELRLPRGTSLGTPVRVLDDVLPDDWCTKFMEAHTKVGFTSQEVLDETVGSPEKLTINGLLKGLTRKRLEVIGDRAAVADPEEEDPLEYRSKNTAEVVEVSSPELADVLWARLHSFIEPELRANDYGTDNVAVYDALGVVPTFRFMRYGAGQAFKVHTDPSRVFTENPRTGDKGVFKTFVTLALYLNDAKEFEGGALNFVDLVPNPRGSGSPLAYRSVATVTPHRGRVAVFEHRATHEAGAVPRGVKHMMQCDVLYRRRD